MFSDSKHFIFTSRTIIKEVEYIKKNMNPTKLKVAF